MSRQGKLGAELYSFFAGHNKTPCIQPLRLGKLKPMQKRIETIPEQLQVFSANRIFGLPKQMSILE